jgi:molybdopterin converting factor subunit 1
MRFSVRLFAAARELAVADRIDVETPNGATVADLRSALAVSNPALAPLLARSLIAVDAEYVGEKTALRKGAEIALIPPVSGG